MKLKLCTALLTVATVLAPFSVMAEKAQDPAEAKRAAVASYGKLPLSFEPTESASRFLARSGNYAVSVGAQESSVAVGMAKPGKHQTLHFAFENANPAAPLSAIEPLPGVTNYYLGQDRSKWRLGVKSYAKLRAQSIYPGVDVIYYGDHRRLEFDFVVAPKADPAAIALSFTGMDKLYKDDNGDLVAEINGQPVRFAKPYAYQKVGSGSKAVAADYELTAGGKVRLHLGDYDRNAELIIDPVVGYASYLGGSGADIGNGIAVDSTGAVYVTGQTCSTSITSSETVYGDAPGSTNSNVGELCDAFVTKYNKNGTGYLYTTLLGGSTPTGATASGNGIALDSSDQAYIVGTTNIENMPDTPASPSLGSYQGGDSDAFIAILNVDGTLQRSSYLGGRNADAGYGIAVDQSANVVVVGQTCSQNFPAYNSFETKVEDCVAFITKLDNALDIGFPYNPPGGYVGASALSPPPSGGPTYYFSDFFGGQPVAPYPTVSVGWTKFTYYSKGAIVLDTNTPPNVEIALNEGESGPLTPATSTTLPVPNWSTTPLGITPDGSINWQNYGPPANSPPAAFTEAYGVAIDPPGDIFVAGGTNTGALATTLWPCSNGAHGAWILKVSGATGANSKTGGCVYEWTLESTPTDSTLKIDTARAVAVDGQGQAYVVGTASGTLGTTGNAYQPGVSGKTNAFLVRVNQQGSGIDYATYLGGTNKDQGLGVAVDATFSPYVTGSTSSIDFPTINPLTNPNPNGYPLPLTGTQGAFVSKFTSDGSALIFSSYMGGSASDQGNAIAVAPDTTNPAYVDMYVAGSTTSQDLLNNLLLLGQAPIMCGSLPAFEPSPYAPPQACNEGSSDAFVAMIPGIGLPTVMVTPGSLNFPAQDVGTTSATPLPVTYFNTNLISTVQIKSISFVTNPGNTACTQYQQTSGSGTPPDCGDQSQIPPAGTIMNGVPSTGTCQIDVVFTPSAQNLQDCSLVISDSASSTPHTVNLSGTGAVPVDKFSASSIAFGSQAVSVPVTQSVTLTNTSINGTLNVTNVAPGGTNQADFSESDNCRPTVAPTAYCTINVTFTPGAAGLRTGNVTVTDNAAGSPHVINLSGTGTGTGGSSSSGALQVSTASVAFNTQPVATAISKTIVLSNTGSTAIAVTFSITGANQSDFVESDNCGGSVSGGGECNVTVKFTPSAPPTAEAATLTITGASTSLTVSLTGTGTSGSTTGSGSAPFTMPTSAGVSTTEGSTASFPFSVAPVNGSKALVSFTCSGPVGSSCSLSPSSFTMDGVTVTTVTLSVNTTGGNGGSAKSQVGTKSIFLALLPFSMMGMLLINKRRGSLLVLLLLALCVAMGTVSCGGGSASSSSGALAPGTYPVTVTAVSNGATQTLTVSLLVNKQ
jgi:hypothetical protein